MPDGNDPLAVMAVHRKLLRYFDHHQRPSDAEQVSLFLQAISPGFRTMLAPQALPDLDTIEKTLRRYYSQLGSVSEPPRISSHTPAPIYAAMGGGDPTRNLARGQADIKGLLHQLRVDMKSDLDKALKAREAEVRTHVMNVDVDPPVHDPPYGCLGSAPPEGAQGRVRPLSASVAHGHP